VVKLDNLSRLALIAVFALGAAACSPAGDAEDTTATTMEVAPTQATTGPDAVATTSRPPETELIVWADADQADAIEEVASAFTDETGAIVTVERVSFGDIRERVGAAGPEDQVPDIFIGASDWIRDLAAIGALQPIERGGWSESFTDASLAGLSSDGALYGVPYAAQAIAMYYNAELAPAAPRTFEELEAACAADDVDACLGIPGAGDGADAYHNYPLISATGGYVFGSADGTYDPADVGLDGDGAIAGAEFVDRISESGVLGATNYNEAKDLFLAGEQPFWITGPWELGGSDAWGFNWSVAKIPTIDGATPRPFVGVDAFFLSARSEHPQLSQSFLLDVIASLEGQTALFDAVGNPPVHEGVIASIADDPALMAFVESAADGVPIPDIPEMRSVWSPLGRSLQLLRNGEVDGATAMRTAAEAVREAIEP
jgi:maltose-binding protein MalE